ncbi:MAG TPA: Rieske (2Fe-2S) protein [Ktedonobacteraceae bacterium]|nr:Rieske (2Fe-2S) protein [Ktedonobacteraceae bacterium]
MSHHDQERFENYLEIERYIEDLQAGRKGVLPEELTSEQAGIYRMVAQLRSAIPEDAAPRPDFVEKLRARLQMTLQEPEAVQAEPVVSPQREVPPEAVPPQETFPRRRRGARTVSRRNLLTGGAVAAASLALGTAAGAALERSGTTEPQPPTPPQTPVAASWKDPLVGTNMPTRWQRVVALEQLGNGVHAFSTESIVGYVLRSDEQSAQDNDEDVIALSAACTHMGCIVQWQAQERNFRCPCHGGLFDEYGAPARNSPLLYLRSLPRLKTRIDSDGYVYVEVPVVAQ